MEWDLVEAPSLADIEKLAEKAFASLPERFQACCENVVFGVEEFPDNETMEALSLENAFDLLGLYHGGGIPSPPAIREGVLPDRIFLYRQPLLAYWVEHEEKLGDLIRHVLVHEIGHHFGFSDEDMEWIEDNRG